MRDDARRLSVCKRERLSGQVVQPNRLPCKYPGKPVACRGRRCVFGGQVPTGGVPPIEFLPEPHVRALDPFKPGLEVIALPTGRLEISQQRRSRVLELREGELLVTTAELDALHDQLYVLACAVNDAERDLRSAGPKATARELRETLDWLLEAARPLRDRETVTAH